MVCWQNEHWWTWFYKNRNIKERLLWFCTILAPPNLVCNKYVHYWNMGVACYASVAGATFRDPYSTILIGIGSCVLRLHGESHLQNPNFHWGMRTACYAFVREPPPESLSLYVNLLGAHHSSHKPLGHVYGVMRWWPLGPATSMPIMWLFSLVIHG